MFYADSQVELAFMSENKKHGRYVSDLAACRLRFGRSNRVSVVTWSRDAYASANSLALQDCIDQQL